MDSFHKTRMYNKLTEYNKKIKYMTDVVDYFNKSNKMKILVRDVTSYILKEGHKFDMLTRIMYKCTSCEENGYTLEYEKELATVHDWIIREINKLNFENVDTWKKSFEKICELENAELETEEKTPKKFCIN